MYQGKFPSFLTQVWKRSWETSELNNLKIRQLYFPYVDLGVHSYEYKVLRLESVGTGPFDVLNTEKSSLVIFFFFIPSHVTWS